jgi:hypothetical protein
MKNMSETDTKEPQSAVGKEEYEIKLNESLELKLTKLQLEGRWIEYDKERQEQTGARGLFYTEDAVEPLEEDGHIIGHITHYTYYELMKWGLVRRTQRKVTYYNNGIIGDDTLSRLIQPEDGGIYFAAGDPKPKEQQPDIYQLTIVEISPKKPSISPKPPHNQLFQPHPLKTFKV